MKADLYSFIIFCSFVCLLSVPVNNSSVFLVKTANKLIVISKKVDIADKQILDSGFLPF